MSSSQYSGMAQSQGTVLADFRSDTVTRPCDAMAEAMRTAPLGDDVYGDDPSVNELEALAATMLGKSAALWLPTGTMSNLVALLAHCQRGEEVLVGDRYHIMVDEAVGASVLGSIALQPLVTDASGAFSVETMRRAVKPDDAHCPISRLLSLENTVSGCVQPQLHMDALASEARALGLAVHLDGARIMNASVATGLTAAQLAQSADSVSVCLSKGLGAPMGSLLCGDEAVVARARRWRKMLGGGTRQAGVVAAAGLYALRHNVTGLADDHRNAERLATGLASIAGLRVDAPQTNMVFVQPPDGTHAGLQQFLASKGVLIGGQQPKIRVVVHKDTGAEQMDLLLNLTAEFFG